MRACIVLTLLALCCITQLIAAKKAKPARSYGERCTKTKKCDSDKGLTQCKGSGKKAKCLCADGHSWNSVTGQCEEGLKSYLEPCHDSDECDGEKGLSSCARNNGGPTHCDCTLHKTLWNGKECEEGLKSHLEDCNEPDECDGAKGLNICIGGKCGCNILETYWNGVECIALRPTYGEICSKTKKCDNGFRCKGSGRMAMCLCSDGHSWNNVKGQCEEGLKSYLEDCMDPDECDGGKGLGICLGGSAGKCGCSSGTYWNGVECSAECGDETLYILWKYGNDPLDCATGLKTWQENPRCQSNGGDLDCANGGNMDKETWCGMNGRHCKAFCGKCPEAES